jgi:hypothetical protein
MNPSSDKKSRPCHSAKNLFDSLENVDYNLKINFMKPLNGFFAE